MFIKDFTETVAKIQSAIREYVIKNNIQSLIVGVSGGIDSALCCALLWPLCKELGIELIGRSLPFKTNKMDEVWRAKNVGEAFCTNFKEISLFDTVHSTMSLFINLSEDDPTENLIDKKIRNGNIMARLRMIYLYDVARANKGLVVSTDNKTERMLGFWTLHGDVGDIVPLHDLWKSEVYLLSMFLVDTLKNAGFEKQSTALENCITAVPTDGLGVCEGGDLVQFGEISYEDVDLKIILHMEGEDNNISERVKSSEFKRNNPLPILVKEVSQ
jgi:NAD+ synthetase